MLRIRCYFVQYFNVFCRLWFWWASLVWSGSFEMSHITAVWCLPNYLTHFLKCLLLRNTQLSSVPCGSVPCSALPRTEGENMLVLAPDSGLGAVNDPCENLNSRTKKHGINSFELKIYFIFPWQVHVKPWALCMLGKCTSTKMPSYALLCWDRVLPSCPNCPET